MDGKTVAVGVLVVLAVLLGGLVASGLHSEHMAYARGSVYDTYLVTAIEVQDNFVSFAVIDTESRRLVFYNMAPPKYELTPSSGVMLADQFRVRPTP